MANKRAKLGDIIVIPLADKVYALGKVLFLSKIFKQVMLVGVYDLILEDMEMPQTLPKNFKRLIYTGTGGVSKGRWAVIDNKSVEVSEKSLTLRIVGNSVWENDTPLRQATSKDWKSLPCMDVAGIGYVEDELRELLNIVSKES